MKLKVCGMKYNPEAVGDLGPDYLGFIFWEGSQRYFGGRPMPKLPSEITTVGVFVDAPLEAVLKSVSGYRLGGIQLHGEETPGYCQSLKGHLDGGGFKGIELIKAFSIGPGFRFEALEPYLTACDYFLFDTKGELPGGTGRTFDWEVLKDYPFTKPFFLSGGIGESHCGKLGDFVRSRHARYCVGIDVNSRFETAPGDKDTEALKRFMRCGFWRGDEEKRTRHNT